MTNEELLEQSEKDLNHVWELPLSEGDYLNRSIAASLLVLARNSEHIEVEQVVYDGMSVPMPASWGNVVPPASTERVQYG